jgi:hypothetical protein
MPTDIDPNIKVVVIIANSGFPMSPEFCLFVTRQGNGAEQALVQCVCEDLFLKGCIIATGS